MTKLAIISSTLLCLSLFGCGSKQLDIRADPQQLQRIKQERMTMYPHLGTVAFHSKPPMAAKSYASNSALPPDEIRGATGIELPGLNYLFRKLDYADRYWDVSLSYPPQDFLQAAGSLTIEQWFSAGVRECKKLNLYGEYRDFVLGKSAVKGVLIPVVDVVIRLELVDDQGVLIHQGTYAGHADQRDYLRYETLPKFSKDAKWHDAATKAMNLMGLEYVSEDIESKVTLVSTLATLSALESAMQEVAVLAAGKCHPDTYPTGVAYR